VPGSRDIIVDEVSGLLVKAEDSQSLANGIRRLIEDPLLRKSIGEEARDRIVSNFGIDHEVQALEDMYSEILGL